MEIIKPRTLSGFMELLPAKQDRMEAMMQVLRDTYSSFGFAALDTPAIEDAQILLAKGGGETEKQIYRFQKGDSDLALRFDLTVPLAKYVALHYNAQEAHYIRRISQMMSNLTNQCSFNQNVSRKITSFFHNFFTVANLIHLFGWNQHLRYVVTKATILDINIKIFLDLTFLTTYSTKYVPFLFDLRHYSYLINVDKLYLPSHIGRQNPLEKLRAQ